jgi:hypothetical protein
VGYESCWKCSAMVPPLCNPKLQEYAEALRFAAASICWDNWHSVVQWEGSNGRSTV